MNRIEFLNNLASTNSKYNLGAGVPPLDLYPKLDIQKCISIFKLSFSKNLLHYHKTDGFLGDIAAETLLVNEKIKINSNQVLTTNGVQEAIFISLNLFKNSKIISLDPYYPGFVDAANILNCNLKLVKKKNLFNSLLELNKGDLFYLASDYSNPTGYTFSISERKQIIELAEQRGFFVFDDATYREFNIENKLPSLFSLSSDRVIHAMSFSKILAPGLRTAFIYLPASLQSKFINLKSNMTLNSSGLTQAVIGGWLKENEFDISSHLKLLKSRLIANKIVLNQFNLFYNGGFFTTFSRENLQFSDSFCDELMKNQSIAICPMSIFSNYHENAVRLCISNIDDVDLNIVLDLLKKL